MAARHYGPRETHTFEQSPGCVVHQAPRFTDLLSQAAAYGQSLEDGAVLSLALPLAPLDPLQALPQFRGVSASAPFGTASPASALPPRASLSSWSSVVRAALSWRSASVS